jgi:hypothetical protein
MPVGITMDFDGIGIADYDEICEALNFPAVWPEGLIAHGSAETDDGNLRVRDVWESVEAWDKFREGTLVPTIGRTLGDRAVPPAESRRELHTFYARERVPA